MFVHEFILSNFYVIFSIKTCFKILNFSANGMCKIYINYSMSLMKVILKYYTKYVIYSEQLKYAYI